MIKGAGFRTVADLGNIGVCYKFMGERIGGIEVRKTKDS